MRPSRICSVSSSRFVRVDALAHDGERIVGADLDAAEPAREPERARDVPHDRPHTAEPLNEERDVGPGVVPQHPPTMPAPAATSFRSPIGELRGAQTENRLAADKLGDPGVRLRDDRRGRHLRHPADDLDHCAGPVEQLRPRRTPPSTRGRSRRSPGRSRSGRRRLVERHRNETGSPVASRAARSAAFASFRSDIVSIRRNRLRPRPGPPPERGRCRTPPEPELAERLHESPGGTHVAGDERDAARRFAPPHARGVQFGGPTGEAGRVELDGAAPNVFVQMTSPTVAAGAVNARKFVPVLDVDEFESVHAGQDLAASCPCRPQIRRRGRRGTL